jgi:hypothetical protein
MSRNADDDQIENQQGDQHEAAGHNKEVIDNRHNDGGFALTDNPKTPHVSQQQLGNVDNQHSGAAVNNEVTSHQHPGESLVFTDNHKDSFVFTDKATASNQQQIETFDNHHSAGETNQVIDNYHNHNIPSPVFHDDFFQVTDQLHPTSNPMHHDLFF